MTFEKKEKLLRLSELTKTLENKWICLSNENKSTANFTRSSKSKLKSNGQENRKDTEKSFQLNSDKKKQENKQCLTCERKHQGDCWKLRTECFVCYNVGDIVSKYSEKSTNTSVSPLSQIFII